MSGSVTTRAATFRPFMRLPGEPGPGAGQHGDLSRPSALGARCSAGLASTGFHNSDPYGGPMVSAVRLPHRVGHRDTGVGVERRRAAGAAARLGQCAGACAPVAPGRVHRSSVHVKQTASDDDGDA